MGKNVFEIFRIAGEGLRFQRKRLESIARNIANANVTHTIDGEPYRREIVVARGVENTKFGKELTEAILSELNNSNSEDERYQTMRIEKIIDDSDFRLVYEPSHPDADKNGYVRYPNINIVTEMVDMISAQRAFEANVSIIESAKNIARDSLDI
ncbi:MAG: flagellar basal body rod protein FlgC [Candidatus Kapaibacteriales bacterium]